MLLHLYSVNALGSNPKLFIAYTRDGTGMYSIMYSIMFTYTQFHMQTQGFLSSFKTK